MNGDFCLATHAVVYLNHVRTPKSSESLAKNICTHPARVRRVLAKLCKGGILNSCESGKSRGYEFTLDEKEVTLFDIAKCLNVDFVQSKWLSGDKDMDCPISSSMNSVMGKVYFDLNELCYQRLQSITIAQINKEIFNK